MSQTSKKFKDSNQKKQIVLTEPKKELKKPQPILSEMVNRYAIDKNQRLPTEHKISAVPLQFEYLPVELLSKEFTKFNNPHKYRIHYLGPRPINSFMLHKKYGAIQLQNMDNQPSCSRDFTKYQVNLRRIIQSSSINEGLRTNSHYRNAIFYRAFQGMNPTLNLKDQIIFDSAFQSGNLDCVIKPQPNVFDIFLRIDSNTRGHTQWYYFSVKNGKKGQKIQLNICNITKGRTLYEQGMKPYIFSRKKKELLRQNYSWQQAGQNISFQEKPLRYNILYQSIQVSTLYELSFQYTFQEDNDEVFFSYSIPFTYSQLLHKIKDFPTSLVKKQVLGITFTGIQIPILQITNFNSETNRKQPKKNILVTSRIHPGQSNSSHMVNGFIEFLLSNCKQSKQLLERVNFFIIPMANPDGVIMGNSRTSAAGKDLNREFKSLKYQLYPEVYLVKSFAMRLKKNSGLFMSLDFHGHSRKKNTFFYGPPYSLSQTQYYKCRVFPRLVQKINSSFRYYGCSFGISEEKRKTGRGVMFQQIKIPYTYTIESSIGLYYDFNGKILTEFEEKAWSLMGADIGKGLSQFVAMQEDYQTMMKDRIATRQRARQAKGSRDFGKNREDFVADKIDENVNDCVRQNRFSTFEDLMQEIKEQSSKASQFDQQVSSDDHDINEDLEDIKLNEFNNLIMQSIRKQSSHTRKKTFYEDAIVESYPSQQIQLKSSQIKISLTQTRQSKKKIENRNNPTRSQKFRNRHIGVKYQSLKKKQTLPDINEDLPSPTKTEVPKKPQKNFIIANKQRYSITAKNFLISQINRYEVIELPKNIQNIRKQLTKGRILINNLFQSRNRTSSLRDVIEEATEKLNFQKAKQRNLKTSRFMRGQCKEVKENTTLQRQSLKAFQRRSSTSHFVRSTQSPIKQGSKMQPKRKKTIDIHDYEGFVNLEVDNMAMTIKSFRGF